MARVGIPNIDIVFKQKAVTAVQRSQRGVLAIIIKDTTNNADGVKHYVFKRGTDVTKSDFTTDNYNDIMRSFDVAVNKVHVFACAGSVEPKDAVKELEKVHFNWVVTNVKDYQQGLANYVKQFNADSKGHKVCCVVANATTTDSMYVVNLKGTGGNLNDDNNTAVTAESYTIRIASTLCNLPMNRSLTYYVFQDLASWDDTYITDDDNECIDDWIDKGYLCLINDDEQVKCARAVNSLTTFTSTETEDMSYIIIVESMNMILEDIYTTFKDYYVGKYKNSYDNQCLFFSSVNSYFRTLEDEEILEPTYDNQCGVDIEAQRNAWTAIGKSEAEDWSDSKVKNMPFRTWVYAQGDVKILNCIEDIKFTITMA